MRLRKAQYQHRFSKISTGRTVKFCFDAASNASKVLGKFVSTFENAASSVSSTLPQTTN
jgi:hypothetical protein